MRKVLLATVLGLAAAPAWAQAPNPQQFLQGLLSGNQNQDRAVEDAFQRGYQRGREDEARQARARGDDRSRRDDRGSGARDDRGNFGGQQPGYGGQQQPSYGYQR